MAEQLRKPGDFRPITGKELERLTWTTERDGTWIAVCEPTADTPGFAQIERYGRMPGPRSLIHEVRYLTALCESTRLGSVLGALGVTGAAGLHRSLAGRTQVAQLRFPKVSQIADAIDGHNTRLPHGAKLARIQPYDGERISAEEAIRAQALDAAHFIPAGGFESIRALVTRLPYIVAEPVLAQTMHQICCIELLRIGDGRSPDDFTRRYNLHGQEMDNVFSPNGVGRILEGGPESRLAAYKYGPITGMNDHDIPNYLGTEAHLYHLTQVGNYLANPVDIHVPS